MEQIENNLKNLKKYLQPKTSNLQTRSLGFHPFHSYPHVIFLIISVFILVIGVTFQLKTQALIYIT